MRQSFAWWSFALGLAETGPQKLLTTAADIGYSGVEMLPPELWPAARDVGLDIVTIAGHDIEHGFNDAAHHGELHELVGTAIETAAGAAIPFVIVFSGNANSVSDETGIQNCAEGLAPLAAAAERAGVTLLLELLNSKVDHPGYQCDRSWWGFEVVRRVDAAGLRVLFDCYHMQLMEGDLLRTIKADLDLIGHFHTAGVPGRRDLDDRQEIHWPAVAGLLRHLGYDGWVGHEFIPRHDVEGALRQAYRLFADPEVLA